MGRQPRKGEDEDVFPVPGCLIICLPRIPESPEFLDPSLLNPNLLNHKHRGRYLKRGVTSEGHVANEVETEQVISQEKWFDIKRSNSKPISTLW